MISNLFLSVGAMKAGTTWLYAQLRDNPDIYFTPEKEIHYFANVMGIENQLTLENRRRKFVDVIRTFSDEDLSGKFDEVMWYAHFAHETKINDLWYQSLFSGNSGRKYCADFSNLYCQMDNHGWSRVRDNCENLKVIYTLRDPIKRLWSHFKFHLKFTGREDDVSSMSTDEFKHLISQPWFWVNAEYNVAINRLRENLKKDELMLLYFEDIRQAPISSLRKIEKFLGVCEGKLNNEELNKQVNKTKDFPCPDEWENIMRDMLLPMLSDLNHLGVSHSEWTELAN